MPYGEKGNDDITRAETPTAIFRRLFQHLDGIGASLKKVFPPVSEAVKAGHPDRFILRALSQQLIELARASEDMSQAIDSQWLGNKSEDSIETPEPETETE